jgi:hypothetical protein
MPPQQMPLPEPPTYSQGTAQVQTYPQPEQYQPAYGYADPIPAAPGQPTMSLPPTSAMPVSGNPISGPPTSVPPQYGMAQTPPPAGPKRSPVVPILAGVAALLLLLAGVMTGLFVARNNALAAANRTIKAREATIADRDKELKQLKTDLEAKSAALDKAQQDLRGTQNESDKNKHDKQVVSTCLQLLLDALDAANRNDKATFEKKLNDMNKPCAEAQVIMQT